MAVYNNNDMKKLNQENHKDIELKHLKTTIAETTSMDIPKNEKLGIKSTVSMKRKIRKHFNIERNATLKMCHFLCISGVKIPFQISYWSKYARVTPSKKGVTSWGWRVDVITYFGVRNIVKFKFYGSISVY